MQRKFHGFLYKSSAQTTLPSIFVDSYFPAPQTHESLCPTTLQFISLSDSNDTTSNISYADPSPGNRTICWLIGAWPRFRVDLAKQILVLLSLSAKVRGAQTEVSLEVVWEGDRTRFSHPGYVWWVQVVRSLILHARHYAHFLVRRNLRCCLRTALLKG